MDIWGEDCTPAGVLWQGRIHSIEKFCNRWQVHTRWGEPDGVVWREYVKVTTGTGLLCLLYRDLFTGGWFLARVYD